MSTLEALDTSSPTLLQTLRGHTGEVTCADVRGGKLVTGGGDKTLRLWGWAAGEGWSEVAVAKQAHRYGVTAAKWSPGGVLIASAGVDGAVRVWCGRSLLVRRLLAAPGATAVRSICWAGIGRLVAGHDDGSLCVWNIFKGSLVANLTAHEGALHAVATLAHAALLLAACTEGVLKVFDMQDVCKSYEVGSPPPAPLLWVDGAHDLGALCADTSHDGAMTATGGHDAKIRIWVVTTSNGSRSMEPGLTLEGHAAAVQALSWSHRGLLASASLDRTARLWSTVDGACLCVLPAHNRYLTCIDVAPDLKYIVTGSNDKTVKMWSISALTIKDELEPPCIPHAHFGVGDLEGIGPVDDDSLLDLDAKALPELGDAESGGGARLLWRSADLHDGAINCVTTYQDLLATASSDGIVRVFRWNAASCTLELQHSLGERGYPVLAADFGANGALLLSGGLDATAMVWDVQLGCLLRLLSLPSSGDGEAGGVRGARVCPRGRPLLLLASDDGVAPLWSLADPDPKPIHVYGGHPEAAVCCAWSPDGRLVATGGAEGELRIHAAPPAQPATLYHQPDAHDLGVQSCDFAPDGIISASETEGVWQYLLATGGSDGLIKLWIVQLVEDLTGPQVTIHLSFEVQAHGGGVSCVRWGAGSVLSSGGADLWARVWGVTVTPNDPPDEWGRVTATATVAVPAPSKGGATATAILDGGLLALGTLAGELSVWQTPETATNAGEVEEDAEETETDIDLPSPRWWDINAVARWLRDYVARVPGVSLSRDDEAALLQRARDEGITGARLMDDPVEDIVNSLGLAAELDDVEENNNSLRSRTRDLLSDSLKWLRMEQLPLELCWKAPHSLLCPLSHRVLQDPARAADGCTYERSALSEWFLAADGPISAVSGRRLRNGLVQPNYRARAALHAFIEQCQDDTLT